MVALIPVLAAKVVLVVDPEYPVVVPEWVTVPDLPRAALMRLVMEMDPVDPVLVTMAVDPVDPVDPADPVVVVDPVHQPLVTEIMTKMVQATRIPLFRPERILAV